MVKHEFPVILESCSVKFSKDKVRPEVSEYLLKNKIAEVCFESIYLNFYKDIMKLFEKLTNDVKPKSNYSPPQSNLSARAI